MTALAIIKEGVGEQEDRRIVKLHDAINVYEAALKAPADPARDLRDNKLEKMYADLSAGRMAAGEATLIDLISTHGRDAELALMLPNIFMTTLPRILQAGSTQFRHQDGTSYRYGYKYTTGEYSFLYVEKLLRKILDANKTDKDDTPDEDISGRVARQPVLESLTQIWLVLYELLPMEGRALMRNRIKAADILDGILPDDLLNVVSFTRR